MPYPRLHREPYGVAALVIPFNWPLAVMMTKLTSALTAGNTAVVKLPPTVPLAALQFGAAFAEALPPGVVNVLAAPGVELAQAPVTHPGIDVISLIYLTWGRRMRPRWRDYRLAVVATLAWAAFTFTFNVIAGTNYGYLNRKPPTASLLDVLGPWPVYLLAEITLVLIVWALMTWPWERARRDVDERPQVA